MSDLSPEAGGFQSNDSPEIAPIPSPLEPKPQDATREDLENFPAEDQEPSLLDEPEIPEACLADLKAVLADWEQYPEGSNYPLSTAMSKTAPDNFRYLYADAWEDAADKKDRRWAAVASVEAAMKEHE